MSADNTIAVFKFTDGRYRVGHFQNIEDFTGFSWTKPICGIEEFDRSLRRRMESLPVFNRRADAMENARDLYESYDFVEYGIEIIGIDDVSSPS